MEIENKQIKIESLFKANAKQNLLTRIAELQTQISHGWGEGIIQESSLDYSIKTIRILLTEYVQLGLFTQEEMDEFWVFVNQSRRILRVRHSVEKLAKNLEENKLNIPESTKLLINEVNQKVAEFRYPKEKLLKVIEAREQSHD